MDEGASSCSLVWRVTVLSLRILSFVFLLVSITVLATDTATLTVDLRRTKVTFNDVYAYRYLLSVGVIGCAYTLLQLPFAMYFLRKGKRISSSSALLQFDFYADKVIALLLASGAGAGFGVTVDMKKVVDELVTALEQFGLLNISQPLSKLDKFFGMVDVSTSFLLLALICMAVLSVLSSLALSKKGKF